MSASARVRSATTSNVTRPVVHPGLSPASGSGSGSVMSPTRTSSSTAHSVPLSQQPNANGHEYGYGYGYRNGGYGQNSASPPFSHTHTHRVHHISHHNGEHNHTPSRASSSVPTHNLNTTPAPSSTPTSLSLHRSSTTPGRTTTTTTRPKMTRNNSHLRRTGPGALVIPIPPTLANSPHLQSPNSIFRRPYPGPRASPGVEEDMWLRDTVPIGAAIGSENGNGNGNGNGREAYVTVTSVSAGAVYADGGGGITSEQGRARSYSAAYPSSNAPNTSSPAFSLLPSSLPQHTAYAKTEAARGRG